MRLRECETKRRRKTESFEMRGGGRREIERRLKTERLLRY